MRLPLTILKGSEWAVLGTLAGLPTAMRAEAFGADRPPIKTYSALKTTRTCPYTPICELMEVLSLVMMLRVSHNVDWKLKVKSKCSYKKLAIAFHLAVSCMISRYKSLSSRRGMFGLLVRF